MFNSAEIICTFCDTYLQKASRLRVLLASDLESWLRNAASLREQVFENFRII